MRSPENQLNTVNPAFEGIPILRHIPSEMMIFTCKIVESIKPEKPFVGII
jgi:hypothetical protein